MMFVVSSANRHTVVNNYLVKSTLLLFISRRYFLLPVRYICGGIICQGGHSAVRSSSRHRHIATLKLPMIYVDTAEPVIRIWQVARCSSALVIHPRAHSQLQFSSAECTRQRHGDVGSGGGADGGGRWDVVGQQRVGVGLDSRPEDQHYRVRTARPVGPRRRRRRHRQVGRYSSA